VSKASACLAELQIGIIAVPSLAPSVHRKRFGMMAIFVLDELPKKFDLRGDGVARSCRYFLCLRQMIPRMAITQSKLNFLPLSTANLARRPVESVSRFMMNQVPALRPIVIRLQSGPRSEKECFHDPSNYPANICSPMSSRLNNASQGRERSMRCPPFQCKYRLEKVRLFAVKVPVRTEPASENVPPIRRVRAMESRK